MQKSKDVVSRSLDTALDNAQPSTNGDAGISIRNGPVEQAPGAKPHLNGHLSAKRKGRQNESKTYKEDSSESDDDVPMVLDGYLPVLPGSDTDPS